MQQLNDFGCYTVDPEVKAAIDENFVGFFADEKQTEQTIQNYFNRHGYLCDTHTAVALCCAAQYQNSTGDFSPMVVDSTASPYKFANNVYRAATGNQPTDDLSALKELSAATNTEPPYPLVGLAKKRVRFEKVIDAADMLDEVYNYLEI
jgi:threonine synthase